MSSLTIIIDGVRPTSKKNNLRVTRNGAYTAKHVSGYEIALQAAAIEAMYGQYFTMLIDKPFQVTFHIWVKSVGSIDLDNATTTALDALQGIVYNNDKYCVHCELHKWICKKGETWRTEISIEEVTQ